MRSLNRCRAPPERWSYLSYRPKRKKPDVAVTPGFESSVRTLGRASTAHCSSIGIQRDLPLIGQRRLTGDATLASLFVGRIYPQSQHGRFPRSNQSHHFQGRRMLDGSTSNKVHEESASDNGAAFLMRQASSLFHQSLGMLHLPIQHDARRIQLRNPAHDCRDSAWSRIRLSRDI
jgi:hypothetical protein